MAQGKRKTVSETDKHLRLLYLYWLLERHTDEDHPLTTNQLRDLMEKERGISMHRTTVYNDIALLEKAGVNIHCYRARANQYYLESRKFELPELKLLIDAVHSSRVLTEEQSRELTGKLASLTSETNIGKLKRNLYIPDRLKNENQEIIHLVDIINDAINARKRISFKYISYNGQKKEVQTNHGKFYTVSPYSLIWDGDHYFLVGYHHEKEDICSFRVSRIRDLSANQDKPATGNTEDFEISQYARTEFRTHDREEKTPVTLVCENEVMSDVIDALSTEIKVKRAGKGHFQTTALVCPSPVFFGWVFQFGGRVQITGPQEVADEYREMLKLAMGE